MRSPWGRGVAHPPREPTLGTRSTRSGGRVVVSEAGPEGGARRWGRPSPRRQWPRSCRSAKAGAPESDPTSGFSPRPSDFARGAERPQEERGARDQQEKEAELLGVGSAGSPCRCGGEGSGAPWCRRQTLKEAVVLVSPPPAAFASARGGAPRFSPAASPLQQLSGTVLWQAARHGIRLTLASAAEPGTRRGGCSSAGMSDSSEGMISLPVPSSPGSGPPCEEVLGRRAQGADGGARSLLPDLAPPPPGTLWAEDGAAATGPGIAARAKAGGRRTAVTYVINEASQGPLLAAESGALQSLREACEVVGAALETLHFGKLDFGETAVLDRFYNAGESDLPGLDRRRGSGSARARPHLPVPAPPEFTAGRREQARPPRPAAGSALAAEPSGGRGPGCPCCPGLQ